MKKNHVVLRDNMVFLSDCLQRNGIIKKTKNPRDNEGEDNDHTR